MATELFGVATVIVAGLAGATNGLARRRGNALHIVESILVVVALVLYVATLSHAKDEFVAEALQPHHFIAFARLFAAIGIGLYALGVLMVKPDHTQGKPAAPKQ